MSRAIGEKPLGRNFPRGGITAVLPHRHCEASGRESENLDILKGNEGAGNAPAKSSAKRTPTAKGKEGEQPSTPGTFI